MKPILAKSHFLKFSLFALTILSCLAINAAPVITIIGANLIKHQINTSYTDMGATAVDDDGKDITPSIILTGVVNVNVLGKYKITYTATDSKGQTTNATREVGIIDLIAPVISSLAGTKLMIICVNDLTFAEPTVVANDNYFLTVNITRSGNFDITTPGSYIITYTATDGAGNTSTYTREIRVKPCSKPLIIGKSIPKFNLYDKIDLFSLIAVSDASYHPSDFINGTNGCSIEIISSNIDSSKIGLYQVLYQATNGFGIKSNLKLVLVQIIGGSTGLAENSTANKIKIYPNPTTDKITITLNTTENYTVALSSADGKTILTKNITSTSNTISVNSLESGIYYLTVKGLNTLYTHKVIIAK